MQPITKVSVIGLGQMGSALGRALLARGYEVTVWNRDPARAVPFAGTQAKVVASVAQAVAASDLIIVCVLDVGSSDALLSQASVREVMAGKIIVQFSSGSPTEIQSQHGLVKDAGGHFLAGGILCFPRLIGRPNALIVYGGERESYEQGIEVLAALSGSLPFLGADPAIAVKAYFALGTFIIGIQGLFYETAAMVAKEGVNIQRHYELARLAVDQIQEAILEGTHRITARVSERSQANVDLTLGYVRDVCTEFTKAHLRLPMAAALRDQLQLASDNGFGEQDVSSIMLALLAAQSASAR